jgi:hypothetical protein
MNRHMITKYFSRLYRQTLINLINYLFIIFNYLQNKNVPDKFDLKLVSLFPAANLSKFACIF